jgi:histidine ammonia-lyase
VKAGKIQPLIIKMKLWPQQIMIPKHWCLLNLAKRNLTIGKALNLARNKCKGVLSDSVVKRIQKNRKVVDNIVHHQKIVYGINTGFGPLCTTLIDEHDTKKLQHNLLMSHSVGIGNFIDTEIAKLMLILKVHSLAMGYSGISLKTLHRIMWHIENDVIPCVPSQGSVGASGDLAPLSHLFLPLVGLGQVFTTMRLLMLPKF